MSNIFDDLVVKKDVRVSQQIQSHKEHSIGFVTNTSPRITLRDTLRQISKNY